jgi:hypothetical protein
VILFFLIDYYALASSLPLKLEMGTGPPGRKSDEERKKILSDRIQRNIVQGGSRVGESAGRSGRRRRPAG